MKTLVFNLPIVPRSKKNSRNIFCNKKTGKWFPGKSKTLREYENALDLLIMAQKNTQGLREPISTPCHIAMRFETKGVMRLDGDNAMQGVWDAMQKCGVVVNDKLFKTWSGEIVENTGLPDTINVRISYE